MRPAELQLNGLDPCALLTSDQISDLGLAADPIFELESDTLGSPGCQWDDASRGSAQGSLIKLITKRSTEYFLNNQRPIRVIDISGFPAIQTTSPLQPSDQDHCLILVDVAAGQTMWTQYNARLERNPGITQQAACDHARKLAQASLTTLKNVRLKKPAN